VIAVADRILVIDDDATLLSMVRTALERHGFSTCTAESGAQGLALFDQVAPELVILDVMMPEMDGWEVCRRIRRSSAVPIIFLTALSSTEDVVRGLVGGGDDYLVKPFKVAELRARVTALLRRARMRHEQPAVLRFADGDLVINCDERKVFARGQEVSLSPTEYNLLLYMAERAGRIIPSEMLYDAIWGSWADAGDRNVKWYIWRLRQKLEASPETPAFILTERGAGYRFSPR
jgi:two-component system KDP operon response regulator KdpE